MGRPGEKWLKGSHGLGTQSALRTLGRNEWVPGLGRVCQIVPQGRFNPQWVRCEAASSSLSQITQLPPVPAALALPCPLGSPCGLGTPQQLCVLENSL